MGIIRRVGVWCVLGALGGSPAAAQESPDWARGLDELMTTQVSSAARKPQRLADTSAAIYVLTSDEIRRSGMTTVPDLLRLVPGVHVAQIDANKWAVTARGFNGRWANKLLVMIDGRSVYTPFLSGVYWDAIDVPVQTIERIEVVRGPGASVWGANAVNGVINIITAAPVIGRETSVAVSAGSVTPGAATVTHAGRASDQIEYRLFGAANLHDTLHDASGPIGDDWRQRSAGASLTARVNTRDTLEVSLRGSDTDANVRAMTVTGLTPFSAIYGDDKRFDTSVWSAITGWTRQLPNSGHLQVESYVDYWTRHDDLDHHRTTVNVGVKHRLGVRGRHDLMWGSEYRRTAEHTRGGLTITFSPPQFDHDLVSAFVQDEIAIGGERGQLLAGTKVEWREFIGWGVQPTARLHWRFTPRHSAWTAVSRALRAPDRVERAMQLAVAGFPVDDRMGAVVTLEGNPAAGAERLTAYEAGFRTVLRPSLTVDLATYYNQYRDLMGLAALPPSLSFNDGTPYLKLAQQYANAFDASAAGGEALVHFVPSASWRVTGGYTLFAPRIRAHSGDGGGVIEGASAPRHQLQLRSSVSLRRDLDLDVTWIVVDRVVTTDTASPGLLVVPAYTRLDARMAWRPVGGLEVAVAGSNLTDAAHPEFRARSSSVDKFGDVPRAARVTFGWHF